MIIMHSPSILFSFFIKITISILMAFIVFTCNARDTINVETPLIFGETLVSPGKIFEFGFFNNTNGNIYIGIWYCKPIPTTIVWVANRNESLSDFNAFFGIGNDGNLYIWFENQASVINVTPDLEKSRASSDRTLQLLDNGNLILCDGRMTLWESFRYPTDTFLPGMIMDNNDIELTSWVSSSEPATGNYIFKREKLGLYTILKNRSIIYWKSGEPDVLYRMFDNMGMPLVVTQLLSNITSVSSQNSSLFYEKNKTRRIAYNFTMPSNSNGDEIRRLLMNSTGEIQYYNWNRTSNNWILIWSEPQDLCSSYNYCGKFSICNANTEPICNCLPGYKSVSIGDEENSVGCVREAKTCHNNRSETGKDRFLNLAFVKIRGRPILSIASSLNETKCRDECFRKCECNAYLYTVGRDSTKCWIWTVDLVDIHQKEDGTSFNLFVRESQREENPSLGQNINVPEQPRLEQNASNSPRKRYVIGFISILSGLVVILVFSLGYISYQRRVVQRNGNQEGGEENPVLLWYESERQITDFMDINDQGIDVPFLNFSIILCATENFSDANKLGRGGFGPVYMGKFTGGQELAVKRLSSYSSQGVEEFRNEVILIAKLQHRNLVRLMGYCVTEIEKILLYEYMPNRSLDSFIFDEKNSPLLDWEKRFIIILGIARGLLYLHQDSRLRIIHRDMKTSNILLDEEMNAKISDFGLARIVQGKGTEANTNKIVGTFGYMSPEYAMDGKFSIKSDVFSFGVVMLEIISGKKNTGFHQRQQELNLLGYAWTLWIENKALDLADPVVQQSWEKSQVMKCINIGLLCVQEDPNDRPTMSTVVTMLSSETITELPFPMQPAFVVRRRISGINSSSSSSRIDSISETRLTISVVEGR